VVKLVWLAGSILIHAFFLHLKIFVSHPLGPVRVVRVRLRVRLRVRRIFMPPRGSAFLSTAGQGG